MKGTKIDQNAYNFTKKIKKIFLKGAEKWHPAVCLISEGILKGAFHKSEQPNNRKCWHHWQPKRSICMSNVKIFFKNITENGHKASSFVSERQLKEHFLSLSQARATEYSEVPESQDERSAPFVRVMKKGG